MRRFGKTHLLAVAIVGLSTLLGATQSAQAGFNVVLDSVSGTGPYTFNYTATIATGDSIVAGNFFRVYDFFGYVPGSITAPADWVASTALSNPTPPPNVLVPLGDDPAVPNLIWTYTGNAALIGPTTILNFTAQSTLNFLGFEKNYVGRATQAGGTSAGQPVDTVGNVRVPGVPEPASMISTGLVVLVLGSVYGFRRRRATV